MPGGPLTRVDLFPYDAGTEDGEEFSLSNDPTSPQGTITSLKGQGKFSNTRMARLTFTLNQSNNAPEFTEGTSMAVELYAETVGSGDGAERGHHRWRSDNGHGRWTLLTYTLEGTLTKMKFTD